MCIENVHDKQIMKGLIWLWLRARFPSLSNRAQCWPSSFSFFRFQWFLSCLFDIGYFFLFSLCSFPLSRFPSQYRSVARHGCPAENVFVMNSSYIALCSSKISFFFFFFFFLSSVASVLTFYHLICPFLTFLRSLSKIQLYEMTRRVDECYVVSRTFPITYWIIKGENQL